MTAMVHQILPRAIGSPGPGQAGPYAHILGDWGAARLDPLCIELEGSDQIVDVTPELHISPGILAHNVRML